MPAPLTPEEIERRARTLVAALNARDFDAIAAMEWFDNESSEFNSALSAAEGRLYRGLEGLRQWARDVDETWEDFRIEIVRVVPAGDCMNVTEFQNSGRARVSGVPLDALTAQVWHWNESGVILRNDSYTDVREAFAAAGVPYEPSTRSV